MSLSIEKVANIDFSDVTHYIASTRKFPILKPEEESELINQYYVQKDLKAAHRLVTSYLRLVVKIALGFRSYGLPMMDLISEGNIGLMKAIKKFNPTLGYKIATYALWWIKAKIKEYILKTWSMVKTASTPAQRKLFFSLRRLKRKITLTDRPLHDHEVEKIASQYGVSAQDIVMMEGRLSGKDYSLNEPLDNSGDNKSEFIDNLACPRALQDSEYIANETNSLQKKALLIAMEKLNERERDIFKSRFLVAKPITFNELSTKYGISRERARQIAEQVMNKVKKIVAQIYPYLKNVY